LADTSSSQSWNSFTSSHTPFLILWISKSNDHWQQSSKGFYRHLNWVLSFSVSVGSDRFDCGNNCTKLDFEAFSEK
jgi:hypothetical protein